MNVNRSIVKNEVFVLFFVCEISSTSFLNWHSHIRVIFQTTASGCKQPQIPADGSLKPMKSSYSVGEKIWYFCLSGFTLEGTKDIKCLGNNKWSSSAPSCIGRKLYEKENYV